jgi:hypothetical protein
MLRFLAAAGHPNPDISNIKKGTDRSQVLATLHKPQKTEQNASGSTDFYVLEYDNENLPGAAVGWFFLDLATFGIWEIPGTIIEAQRGYKVIYNVTYDKKGKVVDIFTVKK